MLSIILLIYFNFRTQNLKVIISTKTFLKQMKLIQIVNLVIQVAIFYLMAINVQKMRKMAKNYIM